MSELFDNLSRILATPNSRRQTLRLIGGTLAGGALGLLHKRVAAQAFCGPGLFSCGFDQCCDSRSDQCCPHPRGFNYCAPAGTTCCPNTPTGSSWCVPPNLCGYSLDGLQTCFSVCLTNQVKCGQYCCKPGELCNKKTNICISKCPSDQVKCGEVCCKPGVSCDPKTNTCTKTTSNQDDECSSFKPCPKGKLCDLETNICFSKCPSGQDECGKVCCPSGETCNSSSTCVGVVTGTYQSPVPAGTRIRSKFGPRKSPVAGASNSHKGIDLGTTNGTAITAAAGGTVIFAGESKGYGNLLIISHGREQTRYAHLQSFNVRKGDNVSKGQQIALSDNTGTSSGPHLHFEIRINNNPKVPFSGDPIDPKERINFQ